MRSRLQLRVLLFLYGAFAHLLFLRIYALLNYGPPGESRSYVDHPLTQVSIAVLGGLYVTWFILPMVHPSSEPARFSAILSAAGRAVGATVLTLETFFLSSSIFLAFRFFSSEGVNPAEGFIGLFIGIQTYGMEAIFQSIPFAVGYGALAGPVLNLFRDRNRVAASTH